MSANNRLHCVDLLRKFLLANGKKKKIGKKTPKFEVKMEYKQLYLPDDLVLEYEQRYAHWQTINRNKPCNKPH